MENENNLRMENEKTKDNEKNYKFITTKQKGDFTDLLSNQGWF